MGDPGAGGDPAETPAELEEELVLSELVSRVLDRGVVIVGDVTISIADIDLVRVGLSLYLTGAETARERGLEPWNPPLPRRDLPPGSQDGGGEP